MYDNQQIIYLNLERFHPANRENLTQAEIFVFNLFLATYFPPENFSLKQITRNRNYGVPKKNPQIFVRLSHRMILVKQKNPGPNNTDIFVIRIIAEKDGICGEGGSGVVISTLGYKIHYPFCFQNIILEKQPKVFKQNKFSDAVMNVMQREIFFFQGTHQRSGTRSPERIKQNLWTMMKKFSGCDLFSFITQPFYNSLNKTIPFLIVRGCAEQVRLIHKNGWVHGDIKTDNFMIDISNQNNILISIIDFGSVLTLEECSMGNIVRSTDYAAAPEVFKNYLFSRVRLAFDQAIDIYALGILFTEILSGKRFITWLSAKNLYPKNPDVAVYIDYGNYVKNFITDVIPDSQWQSLLASMVEYLPKKRCSLDYVCSSLGI